MGDLALRSLGLVLLFELLAVAALGAALRGRARRVAGVLLVVIAGMMVMQRSADPGAFLAGGVLAGAWIGNRLRVGSSTWRTVGAGMFAVVLAALASAVGSNPSQQWTELRTQLESLAGASTVPQPSSPSPPPEEQKLREKSQELAKAAARWALRLVPAGLVAMAALQVLPLVIAGAAFARRRGVAVGVPPFARWQVPFAAVWFLAAGLGLLASRHLAATIVGANLAVCAAAWFALQGAAVVVALFDRTLQPASRVFALVVGFVTAVFAWPIVGGTLALLGLADGWIDFRRLRSTAEST